MSKTAAVFTATGEQGSSVVDSLLKAGYKVTGFSRNTTSAKSKGELLFPYRLPDTIDP
jgi:uncharacterized protein YbjT (DUF2867 family)